MKLQVVNTDGQNTGREVDLPAEIFGIEPNDHAIYLAVKQFMANQRQGTHKTKPRNEVKGSTKKIKKQKGTGTARAGDIKNPLFRGGGSIHGPQPRDYSFKLNKKVKFLAKKSALAQKAKDNSIVVVEDFSFDTPKTKNMVNLLKNLGVAENKTLLILNDKDQNLYLSGRNLRLANITGVSQINIYDLMNAQKVVLSEGSLKVITETFAEKA